MKKLAVIYHSAHGHTEHIARHVAQAAGDTARTQVHLLKAQNLTLSSLPAGDRQSTPSSMWIFAMQHGLVWVGSPVMPEQHQGVAYEQAANRLGSWSGLMAQAAWIGTPPATAGRRSRQQPALCRKSGSFPWSRVPQ